MPPLATIALYLFCALGLAASLNMVLPHMEHRTYAQLIGGLLGTYALHEARWRK